MQLLKAVRSDEIDIVMELLNRTPKPDLTQLDHFGLSLLHEAAEMGRPKILQLLLTHDKSRIDHQDEEKYTPLHRAAARGHHTCVQVLLDSGANINLQDEYGYSPFRLALLNKKIACAYFITHTNQADPGLVDNRGVSDKEVADEAFKLTVNSFGRPCL